MSLPKNPDRTECPPNLTGLAKTEWHEITSTMESEGTFDPAYRAIIELYCQTYGIYRQALAAVAAEGLLSKGHRGDTVNPTLRVAQSAADALAKFLKELGLTPRSRKAVVKRIKEDRNPFAVLRASSHEDPRLG